MKRYTTYLILVLIALSSCKKRGCMDYEALNYDPEAKEDDNTCYYFWIGQNYQGGKIFYIDQSRKHGLISADFDLPNTPWGCYPDSLTEDGINDINVGRGGANSQIIVDACGENTAAGRCLAMDTLGFDDWYLPTLEEMRGVSINLGKIGQGNLTPGYYWCSSQASSTDAYLILNANRATGQASKGVPYRVRPIRSF